MNRRRRATEELEDPPPVRRRRTESPEEEETEESPGSRPLEFHRDEGEVEPPGRLREDSPLYRFVCRLRRTQVPHIRHIQIRVCRKHIKGTLVIPSVYIFFSFTKGREDFASYKPSGDRHEHCIVGRKHKTCEYMVEDRSCEDVAADELTSFLAACIELKTKIVKVQLTIDSNPRVDYDRVQFFNDNPLPMLGLFRNIFRRIDSTPLGIEILKVEVQILKPLREILVVTEFVRCVVVEIRVLEFIEASTIAVYETIGNFGLHSTVGLWFIYASIPIENGVRSSTRIPGFSRETFNECMVFSRAVLPLNLPGSRIEGGPAPIINHPQNPAPLDSSQEQQHREPTLRNVSNIVRIL